MVDKGLKNEVIAVTLPLFDVLTVVEKNGIEKGVEHIRAKVRNDKHIKRSDKKLFEEYLDGYLK